jgi:uncharacterized protein (DUF58 family)
LDEPPEQSPESLDAALIVRRARRLRFRARPDAVSALAGAYLGSRPGTGLTFAELRAYEPGDDVRHLDWNVTARQGRPYVRRFIEERSLTLWLIVDVSASLRFGPDGKAKIDRASQAAALLAAAAIQNGDRAGVLLVSDRIETEIIPNGGARHLAKIVRALIATPAASRKTDLNCAVAKIARNSRRSLVVVLSDFLGAGLPASWRVLSRRNEVMGLRLVEPREETLPDVGLIAVEDLELGRRQVVDTSSKRVRLQYARAAEVRRTAFRAWCAEAGVVGHDINTQEDPITPMLRIFRGRAERRGRPR